MKKLVSLITLITASTAMAHPGHEEASEAGHWFAMDHLLALGVVGVALVLSSSRVRRALLTMISRK